MRASTRALTSVGLLAAIRSGAASPLSERQVQNVSLENPELFAFHWQMLEHNSTSGFETSMSDYLAGYLKSKNLTVEMQTVENPTLDPNVRRENVYAYIGSNRTCRMIMNSHTDVVPPWYPPSDNATDVFGRGSNDAKGSIASQVTAFLELRDQGLIKEGDVCMLYDVGEERYGDGMDTFVASLTWKPEYIITGEPTESHQATGQKGSINIIINSTGETAHSSVPQYGRNAILQLFDFIPKLLNLQSEFPYDDFHGNTTLSLSSMSGGTISNQVADRAVALVNARTGVKSESIWNIITSKLGDYPYVKLSRTSASVDPMAFDVIDGWLPKKIMPYGTDLESWNLPNLKFLLGPGSISTAHSAHEVVSKREMLNMVQNYKEFVTGVLNGTLTPIHNGTMPTFFQLPDTSNMTKRELAEARAARRLHSGCMH